MRLCKLIITTFFLCLMITAVSPVFADDSESGSNGSDQGSDTETGDTTVVEDGTDPGTDDGSGDGTDDGTGDGSGDGTDDGTGDGSGDGTDDDSGDGTDDDSGDGPDDGSGDGLGDGIGDKVAGETESKTDIEYAHPSFVSITQVEKANNLAQTVAYAMSLHGQLEQDTEEIDESNGESNLVEATKAEIVDFRNDGWGWGQIKNYYRKEFEKNQYRNQLQHQFHPGVLGKGQFKGMEVADQIEPPLEDPDIPEDPNIPEDPDIQDALVDEMELMQATMRNTKTGWIDEQEFKTKGNKNKDSKKTYGLTQTSGLAGEDVRGNSKGGNGSGKDKSSVGSSSKKGASTDNQTAASGKTKSNNGNNGGAKSSSSNNGNKDGNKSNSSNNSNKGGKGNGSSKK